MRSPGLALVLVVWFVLLGAVHVVCLRPRQKVEPFGEEDAHVQARDDGLHIHGAGAAKHTVVHGDLALKEGSAVKSHGVVIMNGKDEFARLAAAGPRALGIEAPLGSQINEVRLNGMKMQTDAEVTASSFCTDRDTCIGAADLRNVKRIDALIAETKALGKLVSALGGEKAVEAASKQLRQENSAFLTRAKDDIINTIATRGVHAHKLCLGQACLTEKEAAAMLAQQGQGPLARPPTVGVLTPTSPPRAGGGGGRQLYFAESGRTDSRYRIMFKRDGVYGPAAAHVAHVESPKFSRPEIQFEFAHPVTTPGDTVLVLQRADGPSYAQWQDVDFVRLYDAPTIKFVKT